MKKMLCLVVLLSVVGCKKPEPPKVDEDTRFIQKLAATLAEHGKIFDDENRLARKTCRAHVEIKECADVIPRLVVLAPLPQ